LGESNSSKRKKTKKFNCKSSKLLFLPPPPSRFPAGWYERD
jgi:hypothetical protein